MTTERNIYRILLAAAICYILFLRMCGTKGAQDNAITATVIRDTTFITLHDTINFYVPKITKVIVPEYVISRDSFVFFKSVDTSSILRDFFSTRYYRDSLITKYGNVIVLDSVRENRIVSRSWLTNFKIPTVNEVITEKKRTQVYAGFSGLFSQQAIGAELNLSLKNKKDQQYELGVGVIGTRPYFRIGTKFKLSFK